MHVTYFITYLKQTILDDGNGLEKIDVNSKNSLNFLNKILF